MKILGINAFHGDASAALLQDGRLVAAVAEERFKRIKHWAGFPEEAIRYCLAAGGIRAEEVDHVAVSFNPRAHLLRKIAFAIQHRPSLRAVKDRLSRQQTAFSIRERLAAACGCSPHSLRCSFHQVEHHLKPTRTELSISAGEIALQPETHIRIAYRQHSGRLMKCHLKIRLEPH